MEDDELYAEALNWLGDYFQEIRFMVLIDGEEVEVAEVIQWAIKNLEHRTVH